MNLGLKPSQPTQTIRRANSRPVTSCLESIMPSGTVKWFNGQKGYGFIQPQQGGKDVFVHISALERAGLSTLQEGQKITYEVTQDRGKESATNLTLDN
jgi:CspA family cold shock protein